MNVNEIKTVMTQKFGRAGLQLQKHSPEILLGLGLVGFVATIAMVVKAAKQDTVAEEHKANMETAEHVIAENNMSKEESIKIRAMVFAQTGLSYSKLYGPAAGVGIASIVSILASHGVMQNRQVAMVAAYNLLNEGFKNYRERVSYEFGEEKEHDLYNNLKEVVHQETVEDEEGKKTKVKTKTKVANSKTPSIYSRFFDESNPMWRTDRTLNKAFLVAQQNYLNDLLIIRGHVYLNEAYERLGFPHTKEGAIVGWVLLDPEQMRKEGRAGYIDLGIFDVDNDPAREFVNGTNPTVLIDPNVDGIMFNRI